MARKGSKKRATNHSDFAGPDAEKEAIEKLAESARKANEAAGHNSEAALQEAYERNTLLIKAAKQELDEKLQEVASLRGVLGSRKKVAKKDGCDVAAIMRGLQLERDVATGGASPIVAEHRNIGRVLKILNCPLFTQFRLFDFDDAPAAPKSDDELQREAQLEGEHAGLNGEPKENNPYFNRPGTPQFFGWLNGWQVGADKLTDSFAAGRDPAREAAAH